MKLVDLNVLLYAVNRSAPQHQRIRRWWEDAVNGAEPVGLAWIVVLGFLRLTTKHGVFPNPTTAEQACARIDRWLGLPTVQIVNEDEEHWLHLRRLVEDSGTGGNLTTDAHLAALAISHGATLVSCDMDFARFSELRWINPLSA